MVKFFSRVPAAATFLHIDGLQYANVRHEMHTTPLKRVTIRTTQEARMMRVSHTVGGEAFVYLGMAGEAIAVADNLPFGVSAVVEE